jgi:hypothetical protein
MKKATIIIGPANSGKTLDSRSISIKFDHVRFFNGNLSLKSPFAFSSCSKETELIVIDEFKNIDEIEAFYSYISEGILVDKPQEKSFVIYPEIVIVCKEHITADKLPKNNAFLRRFDIIDKTS